MVWTKIARKQLILNIVVRIQLCPWELVLIVSPFVRQWLSYKYVKYDSCVSYKSYKSYRHDGGVKVSKN